jgi:hypothetical protein
VESLIFAVEVRPEMADALRQQAVDLRGPLHGVYGRSRRKLGFDSIRVWLQTDPQGRLTMIILFEGPNLQSSLEAQRESHYPIDDELKRVFAAATGLSFDEVANLKVEQLIDWSRDAGSEPGNAANSPPVA